MFRRLRWFIGMNHRAASQKRLPNAKPNPPRTMLETVQEIAIYIHRFHNLDLFQQGWYQIKISMRWEDEEFELAGTPARVVQYEAPDLGPEDAFGVWKIDDTDNSFSTQPFRIRYARQDVPLSLMISFNLSLGKYEGLPTSAVILKFELMYAPMLENGSELQASLDACPASVHEFRIPPKALLGLHSYCPVYFDSFHAVLVDVTIHVTLLRAGIHAPSSKVSSNFHALEGLAGENLDRSIQVFKALIGARDRLLEELQKLSKAINQTIDLTDFISKLSDTKMFSTSLQADGVTINAQASGQLSGEPQSDLEKANGIAESQSTGPLNNLSKDDMLNSFHSLGNQNLYLWNTFLNFHRANKKKILECLIDTWASDRKAEWSIWMVYSKIEMPHHYLNSVLDESSSHGGRGKVQNLKKLTDDPAHAAATRAELHRRSIAQMKINNQSIQDMQIFEDPSRIPIIILERVVNVPFRTTSGNSYFSQLDQQDTPNLLTIPSFKAVNKSSVASPQQNGRVLKIVIFVHGFQGHHLDLRLVRNQWLLIDPKAEFLMSAANEEKTSGDFREMGLRLAQEVISFVKRKMDKVSRHGTLRNIKLSFVGHSIGNVIIRTALAESSMEPYLRYLHTYVSISGPHLGYLYSSNSLFNSGLWVLKKFKGTQCIHQLTLTDDPDLQNTFFYKLCKQKTLDNFRNIILLSSPQDGYVPYHSARIELCQAASWDYSKRGKVFLEMLHECLEQIRVPSEGRVFMRCDVNFDISNQGRNLNTIIGRAAHIEFLETDIFARFIMWSFPDLFR